MPMEMGKRKAEDQRLSTYVFSNLSTAAPLPFYLTQALMRILFNVNCSMRVQRSSLVIIARARRERPGDEASTTQHCALNSSIISYQTSYQLGIPTKEYIAIKACE